MQVGVINGSTYTTNFGKTRRGYTPNRNVDYSQQHKGNVNVAKAESRRRKNVQNPLEWKNPDKNPYKPQFPNKQKYPNIPLEPCDPVPPSKYGPSDPIPPNKYGPNDVPQRKFWEIFPSLPKRELPTKPIVIPKLPEELKEKN